MMKRISCPRYLTRLPAIRGVAAVEFAIVLIPMVLLVFGITEYGRALYHYNTIAKAVRDSTRMLSQYDPSEADYPRDEAECLVTHGNTDCAGSPLLPDLTAAGVTIAICNYVSCPADHANVPTVNGGTINLVRVRVSGYVFNSLVPFVTNSTTLDFNNISTTMRN